MYEFDNGYHVLLLIEIFFRTTHSQANLTHYNRFQYYSILEYCFLVAFQLYTTVTRNPHLFNIFLLYFYVIYKCTYVQNFEQIENGNKRQQKLPKR